MSASTYFAQLGQIPLLSPERERALAARLRDAGDRAAADQLVTANLRLVAKIARECWRPGTDYMERVQEGNLGLVQAVRRFDPDRGFRLSTYAVFWIRAYIFKFLIANARLVKIGTTQSQRRLFFGMAKAQAALDKAGVAPEPAEVAQRMGVSPAAVREMSERMAAPESSLEGRRARRERLESLPAHDEPCDLAYERAERHALIGQRLEAFASELGTRDRRLFEQRWRGEQQPTLAAVSSEFGVSRERVRQLEQRLLGRLRKHLVGLAA